MTEDAQMKIRLPQLLKEHIEAAARDSNRSLNGEIVYRLEASFGFRSPDIQPARRAMKGATEPLASKIMLALTDSDYEYIAGRVARILQRGSDDEDADAT